MLRAFPRVIGGGGAQIDPPAANAHLPVAERYHCHRRPGFERPLLRAGIHFNRGRSFTASFKIVHSRRGVSLESMKSSGRSGPHC